jgi:hypothetical protein
MALNKAKCGAMLIGSQSSLSTREKATKNIAGVPIVASYKYLGVIISKTL